MFFIFKQKLKDDERQNKYSLCIFARLKGIAGKTIKKIMEVQGRLTGSKCMFQQ